MTITFESLQLLEPILRAVREQGYDTPTPIQTQTIPGLLKGRDVLGIAQTGTGKTAAFALPILDLLMDDPQPRLARKPSVLVLAPTRELAAQIGASFEAYGRHGDVRTAVIFGGVGQAPQVKALRTGIDVLVATPGRLVDLIEQRHVDLSCIEVLVLDEADRMLDMGFIHAVRKIVRLLPSERQSILFSATMPKEIDGLARSILRDPLRVEVTPPATTVERIEQSVHLVERQGKRALLEEVLRGIGDGRALVFTRTKRGADRVVKNLRTAGIAAEAIHGNKSQSQREKALGAFRDGRRCILVATDIAARGIDVPEITHVINFDLPNEPESYVHRIGRTGRAGRVGIAISFCSGEEQEYLRAIQKKTGTAIPVVGGGSLPPAGPGKGKGPSRGKAPAARPRAQRPAAAKRRSGRGGPRGRMSAAGA